MKGKLIIIEGAQGSGKTTITRHLRECLLGTTLISMSGVNDKTKTGKNKCYLYHINTMQYIYDSFSTGMNFVLDRSYFSEKVYCDMGFKPYSINENLNTYLYHLDKIKAVYDVKVVLLTADRRTFDTRLKRTKHGYQEFSTESSLEQQSEYITTFIESGIDYKIIDTVDKSILEIVAEILNEGEN